MLTFKEFLLEYLVPKQAGILKRSIQTAYPNHDNYMTPDARSDTDHFFGKGNDKVTEDIKNYDHDKSEVHKKVEQHLGKPITHEEYTTGTTSDKYGRQVKLGKQIQDPKLQQEFASDTARAGTKAVKKHYVTVVRGLEVGGQTNSKPDANHPKGHSWGEISCKNVDTGDNRKYLKHEIAKGTVVVRVHDHNDQEIYRATLHPHYHVETGKKVYALDSEYGIKHPSFTEHSHDVAKRLSSEYSPGEYIKDDEVYDNNQKSNILHPNTSTEDLHKAMDHPHSSVRIAALNHHHVDSHMIDKGLEDKSVDIRRMTAKLPNLSSDQLHKALSDSALEVKTVATQHPKLTPEHIDKVLTDDKFEDYHRMMAMRSPKCDSNNIHKALNDKSEMVRYTAIKHINAKPEHIDKALNDESSDVRRLAVERPNINSDQLHKALKDSNDLVKISALNNSKITLDHVHTVMNDKTPLVRVNALRALNRLAKSSA